MTKLKALAANRWFWRVVGAIVGGLLIWFVGPLIAVAGYRPLGWWPLCLLLALLPILLVGLFWWAGASAGSEEECGAGGRIGTSTGCC